MAPKVARLSRANLQGIVDIFQRIAAVEVMDGADGTVDDLIRAIKGCLTDGIIMDGLLQDRDEAKARAELEGLRQRQRKIRQDAVERQWKDAVESWKAKWEDVSADIGHMGNYD